MATLVSTDKKLQNFRRNLRQITAEHGSKTTLCEAVQLSTVHLRRLIAGPQRPSLGLALRIAEFANVRVDDFFLDPAEFARLHARRNKS